MKLVFSLAYFAVFLYFLALLIRVVLEWVQLFSREWRPKGLVLVVAEIVYTVTDPPLKFLREKIPPLRIGHIALDLGFLILMIGCSFLMSFLSALAR